MAIAQSRRLDIDNNDDIPVRAQLARDRRADPVRLAAPRHQSDPALLGHAAVSLSCVSAAQRHGAVDGKKATADSRHFDEAISRSDEHTSELQSLMRTSYAVF